MNLFAPPSPRFRRLAALLAPVALGLAALLLPWADPNADLQLALDRDGFLARSEGLVRELGYDIDGWEADLDVKEDELLARYLRSEAREDPELAAWIQRVAPPMRVVVTWKPLTESGSVVVDLAPDGSLVGLYDQVGIRERENQDSDEAELVAVEGEDPGTAFLAGFKAGYRSAAQQDGAGKGTAAEASGDREEAAGVEGPEDGGDSEQVSSAALARAAELARAAIDERLGSARALLDEESLSLAPDSEDEDAGGSNLAHRFVQKPALRDHPEIELELRQEVRGGRLVRNTVDLEVDDDYGDREVLQDGWVGPVKVIAWILLPAISMMLFGTGLLRYWQRFQEGEVSHGRALLLSLAVGLITGPGVYYLIVANASDVEGLNENRLLVVGLLVAAVGPVLIFGLILGMIWAGAEGDLRKAFPERLVALDAFVSGKWWTKNVARAILSGASYGAWGLVGTVVILLLWRFDGASGPELRGRLFLAEHPWQLTLFKSLLFAIPWWALGLMAPLSLFRERLHRRRLVFGALTVGLWLATLIGTGAGSYLPNLAAFGVAAVVTAVLMLPFLHRGVLASFSSFLVYSLGLPILELAHQSAPALRAKGLTAGLVLLGVLGLTALALRFGREVSAEEVRPGYARNILEREALSAELDAAGEAQNRMLPATPPPVPGAELSGRCAEGALGDFYDFVALPGGRVGIVGANFGRDGLAAALRTTLAKGFLMSYGERGLDAQEVLTKLALRLDELVGEDTPETAAAEERLRTGAYDVPSAPQILPLAALGGGEARGISLAYLVFDPVARSLTVAYGGNPPLVLHRRAADGALENLLVGLEVDVHGTPAADEGGPAVDTDRRGHREISLAEGDAVFLATVEGIDGLAPLDRQVAGNKRWQKLIRKLEGTTESWTADGLLGSLEQGGVEVGTVVALRVLAEPREEAGDPEASDSATGQDLGEKALPDTGAPSEAA